MVALVLCRPAHVADGGSGSVGSRARTAPGDASSWRHTLAALSIRCEAVPWAMRPSVPASAGDDDHRVRGVGAAGNVGADIQEV